MANVLLVDDQPDVLTANQAALAERGHHVTMARSEAEALSALEGAQPDAIVLETMVSGPTAGFAFAQRVAAELPDVPLILLTRADDVLDRATRRAQDRDGWIRAARFMEKPVPPDTVGEEVDHVLHERAAAALRSRAARAVAAGEPA